MRDLAREGMTMLIVTHEIAFAREVADRVLFIDGGVIVEHGPPAEVLVRPTHPRTQDFLHRVLHPID
jgi:polar amino acid transport system ATP-binding protein